MLWLSCPNKKLYQNIGMGYLLSIVVPTRDRYVYLKKLVELIDSFKCDELELVIQDNSSDNSEFVEYLKELNSKNVKYFYISEKISMAHNSDLAILNSTGKYVCFIGDDDGVFPEIMDCVKEAESKNIDAIISKVVKYNWPDYADNSRYHVSGVVLEETSSREDGFLDTKKELNRVIDDGFGSLGLLPKVYQGIVSRNLLIRLYDKCGTFFPGPTPDMANAVSLAIITDRVFFCNRRLIITGQSKSLGGGERLLKGVLKKISEVPYFSVADVDSWDPLLPNFWCAETVWPNAGISAMKQLDYKRRVPYTKIYARFVYKHKKYADSIIAFQYNAVMLKYYILIFKLLDRMKGVRCRISYILSLGRRIDNNRLYRNLNTINEVISI